MAGIFRSSYSTNFNSGGGSTSPPSKRFTFSAFCTSPGTLQDVTMENSYGTGCRSPLGFQQCQGTLSPTHPGRSIREFEEQMAALRSENFNLKLRLYFVDEATGFNSDECKKEFIDLKVEIEILRKEIREKQELLKEAAMAMTQMENEQKAVMAKSEAIIENLNERIQYLEMDREGDKKQNVDSIEDVMLPPPLPPPSSDNPQKVCLQQVRGLEDLIKYSEEQVNAFQKRIAELEEIVRTRDDAVLEYEAKVKELAFTNGELVESLDRKDKEIASTELQTTRENLEKHKMQLADTRCMLQDMEEQLAERNCLYEKACLVIQKLMLSNKRKRDSGKRVERNSADDLLHLGEDTRICRSTSDSEMMMAPGQESVSWEEKMKAQEAEIEQLKTELKKRTIDLQNLVNKELWEKNREIERLTRLVNERKQCLSPTSPRKEPPSVAVAATTILAPSFTEKEYLRALEQNKELQSKVDVLIQRLSTADQNGDALISGLRSELQEARQEVDSADKWRRECTDICSMLSNRLEELGGFLNSLLQHKDVLGFLGADRRKAMRKAVDRSLDLSKSLNMTLSCSLGASTLEQSFLQLSNLSGMLIDFDHHHHHDNDDDNDDDNRTFNSHETLNKQQQQSIATLRAENTALKRELDKRRCSEMLKRERRSLPIGLVTVENHSESEAWSEPDRKVSMARIGLEEHHKMAAAPTTMTTTTGAGAMNVTKQRTLSDSDDSETLNQSRNATKTLRNNSERIVHLEQLVAQRDERILDIQCQLVDADNRLKQEHLRVMELTKEVEQLRRVDNERDHEKVDRLMRCLEEKTIVVQQLQVERDQLVTEVQLATTEVVQLKANARAMQQQYDECQLNARQRLEQLRGDLNALLEQRLSEQERQHQHALERDWIARELYEERQQQLETVQRRWKEAQNMIECFTDNEKELKQSLVDSELEKRSLQKQFDESTLQASKAIMERTKALNENLLLEWQIMELRTQIQAQDECQRCLQNKIEQLQGIQMALQQQIVTQQQRAPVSDDVSHSGYTSEEVPMARAAAHMTDDQRPNNLSPDLGIESDAAAGGAGGGGGGGGGGDGHGDGHGDGRLNIVSCSSLLMKAEEHSSSSDAGNCSAKDENNHQVIKTTTHNGGGDGGGGSVAAASVVVAASAGGNIVTTAFVHDCVKVDQENTELRRKLNRTKRALEDTYQRLRVSNERKAQIEKDIKTQILKTHDVLKNVRENLEGEK